MVHGAISWRQWVAGLALAGAVLVSSAPKTAAAVCGMEPVRARGEPSRFDTLARAKARAAWRAKVRALPALGPKYAAWAAAQDIEERCIRNDDVVYCIFVGTPCMQ